MSSPISNNLNESGGGGFYAQQEALSAAAALLREEVPDGCERLEYEGVYLGGGRVSRSAVAFTPSGEEVYPKGIGRGLTPILGPLREAMYRPGEGSWFSIRMTVWADGRSQARFSYDEEPNEEYIIGGIDYLTDQHYFPIDEDKQPEWLKRKLAEGVADLRHFGKRSYPGWLQDMIAAGNKPAWL